MIPGRTLLITGIVVLASLARATAAHPYPAAVGCGAATGKQIVLTRGYRFTLLVGTVEDMYMPRQVRVNHLKHGEVMLRGRMATSAMLAGGPIHHLEIQICTRPAGTVVTDANPNIVLVDETAGRTTALPIAVMEDISKGVADLHYGNNIAIPARHRFAVTVTWSGERATFRFVSPRA